MRACTLCGKTTKIGMDTTHKHGGQWAMRAPRTQKLWRSNLQVAKVEVDGLGVRKMKFCIKCLRLVKAGDHLIGMQAIKATVKPVIAPVAKIKAVVVS